MNINNNSQLKPLFFFFTFITLFLFSYFYTTFYPNTTGGDEVFYLNLATRMLDEPFGNRVAIGITQLLNFGWPVMLSYYPDFSLEFNITLTLFRILILTFSVFYFFKTFKVQPIVVILLIPFIFQASIYAGSLIRDDLIFSFYLLTLSLLKNISIKTLPLILFTFIILITLRVPLIISAIPFIITISFKFVKESKIMIFFVPFLSLLFIYLLTVLGIESYITSKFISSIVINPFDMIRPFLSPINPFLVTENIRYDNPIIFILMSPAKIFFISALFILLTFKSIFPIQEILFIILSALPYMLIPVNLGMRQALPIQFCLYALIISAAFNIILKHKKKLVKVEHG